MPALLHSPFAWQKPPAGSQIDWSHPLAIAIEGAWGVTAGDATPSYIQDVAGGQGGPMLPTSTVVIRPGRSALSPYFGNRTTGYKSKNALPAFSGSYSFVTWFCADSVPSASEGQPVHVTSQETFTFAWSHSSIAFRQAVIHRNSAGTYSSAKLTSTLLAGAWYQIAGVYDGVAINAYLNGRLEARTTCSPGSSSKFQVELSRVDFSEPGISDSLIVWNKRALTKEDIWQLYEEPYAMLRGTDVLPRYYLNAFAGQGGAAAAATRGMARRWGGKYL